MQNAPTHERECFIRVSQDLGERLKARAEAERRTQKAVAERALEAYLKTPVSKDSP